LGDSIQNTTKPTKSNQITSYLDQRNHFTFCTKQ